MYGRVTRSPGVVLVTELIVAEEPLVPPVTVAAAAKLPVAFSIYNLLSTLKRNVAVEAPDVTVSPAVNEIAELEIATT